MEVVGTVAATAQLVGMIMKIVESIATLHDLVKHVPGRYHRWEAELATLKETVCSIQNDSALQSVNVIRVILKDMNPKIEKLVLLCRKHSPRPKSKPVERVLTALSACAVEPHIIQTFESLEHDKTHIRIASNPTNIIRPETHVMRNNKTEENFTASPGKVNGSSLTTTSFALVPRKSDNVSTQKLPVVHASHNMPSMHQYSPEGFGASHRGNGRRSSYTAIKLVGNRVVVGTTRGDGANFDRVDIHGSHLVVGYHERGVVDGCVQSRSPSSTRGADVRRHRRNWKKWVSAKIGSTGEVLRENAADEKRSEDRGGIGK
ncbi:hypothetical protein GGR51DRAFT_163539 [Nemania sp. FL0031]|nr:hypothetical protein GGR51DRAFT_163539 [Nemania sp. FL0031]